MTRTASSSQRRRAKTDVEDMNSAVVALRQKLFESERRKARLWGEMVDLKGKTEEIKGRLN